MPSIGSYISKTKNPFTGKIDTVIENPDINLMDLCAQSDEIELFTAKAVQEVVEFKWNASAFKFHMIGFSIHMAYMIMLMIYSDRSYIHYPKDGKFNANIAYLLLIF